MLIQQLETLAKENPVEGFWKCYFRLRNTGEIVNHKRLHRVYKQMQLPLRRKVKKRLPARVKEPLIVPEAFTQTWSIDFMRDVVERRRSRSGTESIKAKTTNNTQIILLLLVLKMRSLHSCTTLIIIPHVKKNIFINRIIASK